MTRLSERGGSAAASLVPQLPEHHHHHQQQQQQQQQPGKPTQELPYLHLWEVWQRGSMTPLNPGETWWVTLLALRDRRQGRVHSNHRKRICSVLFLVYIAVWFAAGTLSVGDF